MTELSDAQHEAAHVTVGLVLGLRLIRASIGSQILDGREVLGTTIFKSRAPTRDGLAIMYAAGVAWERATNPGALKWHCVADLEILSRTYKAGARSKRLRAFEACAAAILTSHARAHAAVTKALLDLKTIGPREIEAIRKGEDPTCLGENI